MFRSRHTFYMFLPGLCSELENDNFIRAIIYICREKYDIIQGVFWVFGFS